MSQLHVFFRQELVGSINHERGKIGFAYDSSWRESESAFPISVALPLHGEGFKQETAACFFANLLPEANVRRRICKKLGISEGNDFELLKAIGGDCAGALTLSANDSIPPTTFAYEPISAEQLADWSVGAPDAFSAVAGQDGIRLSLAGAQDKLPVAIEDGKFLLPTGNSPSTHILKFSSRDYSHLPENEVFVAKLATAVGLPAVEIELFETAKSRIAVVKRYDREAGTQGPLRIHQEDFCQAIGISPINKYEKEGGPGFSDCASLIKATCTIPALEINKLLNWSVFNLLVHNADAHGKNLSLLFHNRETSLTPFYDLICTRNYENLDRKMAMTYGGKDDPDVIQQNQINQFAEQLGVTTKLVIDTMVELRNKIETQLPKLVAEFESQFGEIPILERLPKIIRKRMNKALQPFD